MPAGPWYWPLRRHVPGFGERGLAHASAHARGTTRRTGPDRTARVRRSPRRQCPGQGTFCLVRAHILRKRILRLLSLGAGFESPAAHSAEEPQRACLLTNVPTRRRVPRPLPTRLLRLAPPNIARV